MSRLKWFFEKLTDIAVSVIAGIVLYLILGGYISQPLSEISPHLPSLLTVSLVLAIVVGFLYRFYKSVKYHRLLERISSSLISFLRDWDKLREAMDNAVQSQTQKAVNEFEGIRTKLQYDYTAQEVSSAVKPMKYERIDRFLGVRIRNYDVIGNLLVESPFIKMRDWLNVKYMYRDFIRDWDIGRTILVSMIGYVDKHRKSITHQLYWILRLVPSSKTEETQTNG